MRCLALGSRSKATSLLENARAAERAAREERAAAAERRFGALGLGGAGPRGGSGGAAGAGDGGGPRSQQTAPAVPWGSGSIAGGPAAAAAPQEGVANGAPFGSAAAPAFGSAAPAFGAAAATACTQPAASDAASEAATSALLSCVTADQASLLCRILANAAEHPGDAKFRRLRLSNPKVADALLASGALDGLLRPCFGWALEAEGSADACAVQTEAAVRAHAPAMLRAAARLQATARA
jgi:hypothetical protein